jgi:hypothetical protein
MPPSRAQGLEFGGYCAPLCAPPAACQWRVAAFRASAAALASPEALFLLWQGEVNEHIPILTSEEWSRSG